MFTRSYNRITLTISICFSLFFAFSHDAIAHERVTVCYENQDYPPYLIGDSNEPVKPNPGLLVELTTIAFNEIGLEVDYVRYPWKRCMRMIQDNRAVAMFGVIYLPEREEIGNFPKMGNKIDPSRRLMSVDYPIFHTKDTKIEWDGRHFKNKDLKLGTPLGYATVKSLQEEHFITPNESYLPDAGLKLVAQNKLDGYIVEKNVGRSILRKIGLENQVVPLDPPYKRTDLYLFLSHDFFRLHQDKAEAVWAKIAELRETVLDEMLETYLQR